MNRPAYPMCLALSFGALLAACDAGNSSSGDANGPGGSGAGGAAQAGAPGTGGAGAGFQHDGGGGAGGGPVVCTPLGPDDDVDGDGFTPNQGDCDDCDPNRNPDAVEVATGDGETPYDEDCDGEVDEDDTVLCDEALVLDSVDPLDAARAIELCKVSSGEGDWGLVSASWVLADGEEPPTDPALRHAYDLGHGLLSQWGNHVSPRRGGRMLALSSGSARGPDDAGYLPPKEAIKGFQSGAPFGFPKESPACVGVVTGDPYDAAAIQLEVRTPSNATGISFDFDFYTYEWPDFVCSTFNDFFVAILEPFPPGQTDGNVSFDAMGNPISVNNALLEVCGCAGNPPGTCEAGGKVFLCGLGDGPLAGTGFGFDTEGLDHAATGWLRTIAPAPGGDVVQLRFAVYDSGDGKLASTTLVDHFEWVASPGIDVVTSPVPE